MTPEEALQAALAGEHAAVYVYGVVGGRVSISADPGLSGLVRTAYAVHRSRRDQLVAMVLAVGAEPVAAEVSYELPTPATTSAEQQSAGALLEQRCAAVYADMVGSTSRANRQWALDALEEAAVRALGFGAAPETYPGLPEL